jgi:type II secretory pathway predicted ATPase ExeA
LDYAHAHGVVHRDIKPENVIITSTGTAKVMDFGLARSEDRSRLTQTGMIVGTVAYMAPEQALQGTADARSDLYALGCVLYELITGHPPFEADDPIAVITQHINIPPVAPRFLTPAIPPPLEAAILKLLAKDPQERYRSAQELARALEGLRGMTSRESEAGMKVVGAELVQAVRRGVLIGRDDELRILKGVLDEAAGGEGRFALITGQAGTGKTRLSEELITYAHLRGVLVLSARSYEGGTPYEPIIRMLRECLRIAPAERVREALGDYAADLARLAPEVRQKLGSLPESIPLPPEQERARLFESVTRLFSTLSKTEPILLFVDDLHLADSATLQLLRYLAPAVAGERLLLVAAYQSEEANHNPALADMLRQFRRERYVISVETKPLTQQQLTELIQAMAKHPASPVRFAGRIFEVRWQPLLR